jgi:hypothetical protein
LNLPVTTISASTASLATLNDDYPSLFVTKRVENAETVTGEDFDAKVVLGNSYVVSVTISNIGSEIAYNVTFIDTPINQWVFEIDGLTKISYLHISPNETQQFSYLITAKSLGTFNLGAARIDYYSSEMNTIQYIAFSNSLTLNVIEPPEDFSLTNLNAASTLLIVLIIGNIFLIFRLISPRLNRKDRKK